VIGASDWFQKFDLIIFGDGIWENTHGDHLKTKTIINDLIAHGKNVFGYIDLGVSTQNLSDIEMRKGVNGCYCKNTIGVFHQKVGPGYLTNG